MSVLHIPPRNDFRDLLDTARDYRRDGWNAHDATLLAFDTIFPYRELFATREQERHRREIASNALYRFTVLHEDWTTAQRNAAADFADA